MLQLGPVLGQEQARWPNAAAWLNWGNFQRGKYPWEVALWENSFGKVPDINQPMEKNA